MGGCAGSPVAVLEHQDGRLVHNLNGHLQKLGRGSTTNCSSPVAILEHQDGCLVHLDRQLAAGPAGVVNIGLLARAHAPYKRCEGGQAA